jgi:hypothetical protein
MERIKALPDSERKAYAKERKKEMREKSRQIIAKLLDEPVNSLSDIAARINVLGPAASYSPINFLLAVGAGGIDARGYQSWKLAGRQVKKGARAFYIWKPWIPDNKTEAKADYSESDNESGGFRAFAPYPVFRYEDTEGEDIEYEPMGDAGIAKLLAAIGEMRDKSAA